MSKNQLTNEQRQIYINNCRVERRVFSHHSEQKCGQYLLEVESHPSQRGFHLSCLGLRLRAGDGRGTELHSGPTSQAGLGRHRECVRQLISSQVLLTVPGHSRQLGRVILQKCPHGNRYVCPAIPRWSAIVPK